MHINYRALALGLAFFVAAYIAYVVSTKIVDSYPSFLIYTPYVLVAICGAIIGKYTEKATAINCAIGGASASVVVGVLNYCFWLIGVPVDFGGLKWSAIAAAFVMPFFILLAIMGGGIASGKFLAKNGGETT